jgi:hypothetical protein
VIRAVAGEWRALPARGECLAWEIALMEQITRDADCRFRLTRRRDKEDEDAVAGSN